MTSGAGPTAIKGLESEASPPVGEAIIRSDIGYHNRPDGHAIEPFDWLKFLEFAVFRFQPRQTAR